VTMQDAAISSGWVAAGISTVIATLASVVAYLYHRLDANNAKTITALEGRCDLLQKKVDECETDRLLLHRQMAKLEVKIAMLEDEIKELRGKK
jgi:hypothetical protein